MSSTSLNFIVFSAGLAVLHALWSNRFWRQGLFLIGNLLLILSFSTSALALIPLFVFLAWGYLSLKALRYVQGTAHLLIFVLGTLFLFCYLKKYWFLSFVPELGFLYLTIGLSYTFFRVMGMILDARSQPDIAAVGPVGYFNFAMNFPTLLAGPIDRYQQFVGQTDSPSMRDCGEGLERIAVGLFKVMALSGLVQGWQAAATSALSAPAPMPVRAVHCVLSFGLYPIYLYLNFSGYTDVVLGIGRLFGKQYPENFNAPFSSFNFIEFWSRWHMSLSNWLRDYVYNPLLIGLLSRSPTKAWDPYLGVVAYFVTFFLIGIWHGSTWVFAVYGVLLAIGVSANKLYQIYMVRWIGKAQYKQLCARVDYRFLCRGLTFTWYSLCMICFWADAGRLQTLLQAISAPEAVLAVLILLGAATLFINLWEESWQRLSARVSAAEWLRGNVYLRAAATAVLIFGCMASIVLTQKVNSEIIYQAF